MEKQLKCPWCGHERCPDCKNDRWPALRDGCCQCKAKIELVLGSKQALKEMPQLYGPGLRLVRPAASPLGGYPKGKSLSPAMESPAAA
jgi:hypothetical protein